MKFNFASPWIRQFGIVFIVNLVVVSTGMSLTWPSPVLVKLRNETETPLPEPITEEEGSWVVAGGFLISIFTNVSGGMLLDLIGRKYCILLVMLSKLCMAVFLIFANRVWMFIACRTVMGVMDMFVFVVVPVYASEISSKEYRGSLGTFVQIFSSLGIVITLSIGPFLSYNTFSIALAVATAASTIPLLCLPDTPFYLYSKGRIEEAIEVLIQIRGSETLAKGEIEEYKSSKKNDEKVDKVALLKNRMFLKSLILGFLVGGGSQMLGFNAVSFYLQTILESTKTTVRPEFASVVIGFIQLSASFFTTLITRHFGRRPILMASLLGMFFGMLGLGAFFMISGSDNYEIIGFMNYLPIISLILVIFCYSAGIGSLLWVIIAELFEGPSRAFGSSICVSSCTFCIFITTKYFAFMTSAVGPVATYWFFGAMCVIVGLLIAVFLPETKGKSFSEIQKVIENKDKNKSEEKKSKSCV